MTARAGRRYHVFIKICDLTWLLRIRSIFWGGTPLLRWDTSVCQFWDIWDTGSSAVGYIWSFCLSILGHLRLWEFSCRVYLGLLSINSGTFGTLRVQLSGISGLSINSGTFGTLGVQLSGISGASVYQFWDIWDTGSSAVGGEEKEEEGEEKEGKASEEI